MRAQIFMTKTVSKTWKMNWVESETKENVGEIIITTDGGNVFRIFEIEPDVLSIGLISGVPEEHNLVMSPVSEREIHIA